MVTIEIDGKKLEVDPNAMVIEAADAAGIYIPRFCYHKKLTIAANCRMCLVEVEKSRKPLPACATPVTEGMKVFTQSAMSKDAQRAVMEFLLINHPLDCPICDQGGQCELQDFSLTFGASDSQFTETKRAVQDENFGALVATEMTRCIHCTRCVRFSREIAGVHEIGATGRGEHTQIGTYVEKTLKSEVSGNIIDLCPVGALVSRPFLFSARTWELQQHDSVAPHDSLGSAVHVHVRGGKVMRVVPKENEAINETWLSDRDRFAYTGLYSDDRLTTPRIKRNGQWQDASWQEALDVVAQGLRDIRQQYGAAQLGALVAPHTSTEECYLLQRLWRGMGSANVDHRLRHSDVSDQQTAALFPQLGISIADLGNRDALLLIGSHIRHEQPLAAHRIRQAVLQGTQLLLINPLGIDMHCPVAVEQLVATDQWVTRLAAVLKALATTTNATLPAEVMACLDKVQPDQQDEHMAMVLQRAQRPSLILGAFALQHPHAATLRALAQWIAKLSGASYGCFSEGGNSAGAWLAGAVPHRQAAGQAVAEPGLAASQMFAAKLRAYLLYNVEPELDSYDPVLAQAALRDAEFVVACTPFAGAGLLEYADVLLPIAAFSETSGTYVNAEGCWQSFTGAVTPCGEARPGWKVLRVLGNLCEVEDFNYTTSQQIHDELFLSVQHAKVQAAVEPAVHWPAAQHAAELTRISEWPIYRVDNLVRRAAPLQATGLGRKAGAYVHPDLAQRLTLQHEQVVTVQQDGGAAVTLTLYLDARVPLGSVLIPAGFAQTANLGAAVGRIDILRG